MPRFFLHIDAGDAWIEDDEGSELPDLAAAHAEALVSARQLWAAAILQGRDLSQDSILIADAAGQTLMAVPMLDALPEGMRTRLAGS